MIDCVMYSTGNSQCQSFYMTLISVETTIIFKYLKNISLNILHFFGNINAKEIYPCDQVKQHRNSSAHVATMARIDFLSISQKQTQQQKINIFFCHKIDNQCQENDTKISFIKISRDPVSNKDKVLVFMLFCNQIRKLIRKLILQRSLLLLWQYNLTTTLIIKGY